MGWMMGAALLAPTLMSMFQRPNSFLSLNENYTTLLESQRKQREEETKRLAALAGPSGTGS